MVDCVLIMIAAIACYAFVAYLEHKKKLDLIDRGLWKPEETQEKPEHKLITGLFFFTGGGAAVWIALHRTGHSKWIPEFRVC